MLNKKLSLYLLLFLILGATACSDKSPKYNIFRPLSEQPNAESGFIVSEDSLTDLHTIDNNECITLDISFENNVSNLNKVFSKYKFIPLETLEDNIIGEITKILHCDNCFCILDRNNSNVFLFEENGKYRCKLGEKGHGKGEHLDVWNISYDNLNKQIILLDLTGRKLLYYDLDGSLIRIEPIYFIFKDFEFVDTHLYANTGSSANGATDIIDSYKIVIADRTHRPIGRGFKINEISKYNFNYETFLKTDGSRVFYDDRISDTIWNITNNQKIPFLAFKSNKLIPFSEDSKRMMTNELYAKQRSANLKVYNWQITSDYINVNICYNNEDFYSVIYSLKTKRSIVYLNDVHSKRLGDNFALFTSVYNQNCLLSVIEPINLINFYKYGLKGVELSVDEEEQLRLLSEEHNPVILLGKVNEF